MRRDLFPIVILCIVLAGTSAAWENTDIGSVSAPGSVEVSGDLRRAKIYYSRIEQDCDQADITAALESAMGFFRRHLSLELNLRYTPELVFFEDHTQEYRDRIEHLLHQIKDK